MTEVYHVNHGLLHVEAESENGKWLWLRRPSKLGLAAEWLTLPKDSELISRQPLPDDTWILVNDNHAGWNGNNYWPGVVKIADVNDHWVLFQESPSRLTGDAADLCGALPVAQFVKMYKWVRAYEG